MNDEANAWWSQLRYNGVLLSPVVLRDWLPDGPIPVSPWRVDKLRASYQKFRQDPSRLRPFLDDLFEAFLGHEYGGAWKKEQHVPDRFKRKGRKPNRVLTNAGNENEPRFLMVIDDERVAREDGTPHRLGLHRGAKTYADLLKLLRDADVPLGILTNGHYVRLVYAGLDHESWVEWNVGAWFEGGELRATMDGFVTLLGSDTLPNDSAKKGHLLLDKVRESRDRQADLSHVMGTQIRESVETLLEEVADALRGERATVMLAPLAARNLTREQELGALYQGAIRYVMRLVVALYAESRKLLPGGDTLAVGSSSYYESYSVEGLYQLLHQAATDGNEETMKEMRSAWPRLLALFRAIHDGSGHTQLQIPAYGGQLFKPANAEAKDSVLAALAVIEHPDVHVSDWTVYRMLRNLRVGKFKVGRGKWQPGPVDFSDLRTEYIGMMYEGLLDYDLRAAREEDGGIIFLRLGDEPALPLNVLEQQSEAQLKKLITESKKGGTQAAPEEEGEDTDEEATADAEADDDGDAEEDTDADATDDSSSEELDGEEAFDARVHAWACKAVEVGALFGCTPKRLKKLDKPLRDAEISRAARRLVLRAVPPGSMYLVRWSGTRKGSGTFYTKPALAVPTTQRTVGPLVYDNYEDPEKRVPKTPEQILDVKVCDPAMGSGSFLVAAVRTLTEALKESFETHVFPKVEKGERVTSTGDEAIGLLTERLLQHRGKEGDDERLLSAYKRAVVEHCIYGVDLNPLAVELGKLSLWIETMDPKLSFTFLDHKIKCGNSLIGAWQVQAEHYPLGAWERDLGDGASNPRTKRLKKIRKDVIVPEMKSILDQYSIEKGSRTRTQRPVKVDPAQQNLFGRKATPVQARFAQEAPRIVRKHTVTTITEPAWDTATPSEVATYERNVYAKLHTSVDPREQEADYHNLIVENRAHQRQKFLLDMWCACWFWPIRSHESDPSNQDPLLTPRAYYAERERAGAMADTVRAEVQRVADRARFFHWEIEFPEVFHSEVGKFGFDAVLGNPPWETAKPKDVEFFTRFDPAIRILGKRDANRRKEEILSLSGHVREEYWEYREQFQSLSNWIGGSSYLSKNTDAKGWVGKYCLLAGSNPNLPNGSRIPFTLQGSADLNLFKLFTEKVCVVAAQTGRVGFIAPSALYSDFGTGDLRRFLLDSCRWEWLFCFENRRKIFDIDSRYKFAAYVVERSGRTEAVACRFMEVDLAAWSRVTPPSMALSVDTIRQFSPSNSSFVEVVSERDLEILKRILTQSQPLESLGASYKREFDMTNDVELMVDREASVVCREVQAEGDLWLDEKGTRLYPLLEGRNISHFTSAAAEHVRGKGRTAKWEYNPPGRRRIIPNYLIPKSGWQPPKEFRVGFCSVTSPTNLRTIKCGPVGENPCGNSVGVIYGATNAILGALNSYALDFAARMKLSGLNANWFIVSELPIAKYEPTIPHDGMSPVEHAMAMEDNDVRAAEAYGLTDDDMRWILRPNNADNRNLWRDYRRRIELLESAGQRGHWYSVAEYDAAGATEPTQDSDGSQ